MDSQMGKSTSDVLSLARSLARAREQRAQFRRMAEHQPGLSPVDAIHKVVANQNLQLPSTEQLDPQEFTNALYPTFTHAALYYKPQALVKWCNNSAFGSDTTTTDGIEYFSTDTTTGTTRMLRFHAKQSVSGGSKMLDQAWIVVDSGSSEERYLYSKAAKTLFSGDSPCSTLGMHEEGVADTIMQLSTTENNQMCTEMPSVPADMLPSRMFDDASQSTADSATTSLKLRNHRGFDATGKQSKEYLPASRIDTPVGEIDEHVRSDGHAFSASNHPIHSALDRLTGRGRLPALLPSVSTNCRLAPPVRVMDDALEINSGRACEHAMMVTEAALSLQSLPGIKNRQETLCQNAAGPVGLTAKGASQASLSNVAAGMTKQLAFSIDMMQIYWGKTAGEMLYTSDQASSLSSFNDSVRRQFGERAETTIQTDDLPHMTMNYPGYQRYANNNSRDARSTASAKLLSHAIRDSATPEKAPHLVENLSVENSISREEIMQQIRAGIGRNPEESDVETYVRLLAGSNYLHEISGDTFDFKTWSEFVKASACFNSNTSLDVTDSAYNHAVLDGEMLLYARMLELESRFGGEHEELKLEKVTSGSSYSWDERHAVMDEDHSLRNNSTKRSLASLDWHNTNAMAEKFGAHLLNPILRHQKKTRGSQRHWGSGPSGSRDR